MRNIFALLLCSLAVCSSVVAQNADCSSAKSICKKDPFRVRNPRGEGADAKEADFIHCFMNGDNFGQAEENSTWIKFEIKEGGSFAFTITPDDPTDDIDFVVFRLPANGDCTKKEIVRCMASGARGEDATKSPCMGPTGLRAGESDSSEDAGCQDQGDNTWLAPLKTAKGEQYVILVSNVSGPRGWSISFSGSAKLPCEEKPIAKKDPKKDPKKDTPPTKTPPATPPVTTPPPTPVAVKKPEQIKGREVVVDETVKIKNNRIKVKIWDSQIEDGDVVSIYIGEKLVLDHHRLKIQPQEFEFELPAGVKEHYLTVYADDFGKSEPNTAAIIIYDGVKEQRIDLTAGRKTQESVKIVVE